MSRLAIKRPVIWYINGFSTPALTGYLFKKILQEDFNKITENSALFLLHRGHDFH